MRVDELVQFFGSVQRVADFYGVTREAIYMWRKRPGEIVPKGRAAEAVAYSKGKLSLNPELYKKKDNTSNERKNDS
ncbi:TPA: Cro/CI family transcriptional regulator [Escherichia coli]|uniref:Cell division protein n=1 Tax=Escherichia coli TaxID=562 RepID=A0AAP7PFF5_ECOLX|nr:Cro/CI family transcriptional regulator [Escherichia coli]EEV2857710.1 cell division protein [Escherichia coli O145]EEW3486434.1 cell division protein [Escherichia coli O26]EFB4119965.1 cell division protein [Escherichia coli O5]EFW7023066.1 cell division protein [Shigella sonnei]EKF4420150.1 cell division protein [Escherichia coli O113]EKF4424674.1 cell division protein [Escherichia coli O8]EKK3458072.1 cell division protein [Escherichia coli O174]EKK3473125.1 cell division protein [Esc